MQLKIPPEKDENQSPEKCGISAVKKAWPWPNSGQQLLAAANHWETTPCFLE